MSCLASKPPGRATCPASRPRQPARHQSPAAPPARHQSPARHLPGIEASQLGQADLPNRSPIVLEQAEPPAGNEIFGDLSQNFRRSVPKCSAICPEIFEGLGKMKLCAPCIVSAEAAQPLAPKPKPHGRPCSKTKAAQGSLDAVLAYSFYLLPQKSSSFLVRKACLHSWTPLVLRFAGLPGFTLSSRAGSPCANAQILPGASAACCGVQWLALKPVRSPVVNRSWADCLSRRRERPVVGAACGASALCASGASRIRRTTKTTHKAGRRRRPGRSPEAHVP